MKTVASRFATKYVVHQVSGCWLWTGYILPSGYGRFSLNGAPRNAHRVSYELHVGPIPAGLEIDHLCRVRCCVNPGHLEPVTTRENMLRGTSPAAAHARQTHCRRGHLFDPSNTYIYPQNGARSCRTCKRDRDNGYYLANKPPKPKGKKK